MAVSEERVEHLEQALHQAWTALQGANNRITALEPASATNTTTTATPATTPSASMVDMCVLGKPSTFDGDEASWKSWSFFFSSSLLFFFSSFLFFFFLEWICPWSKS